MSVLILVAGVIGGLALLLVGGLFGLAVYARRGEGRGDVPGTRSLCRFGGPEAWLRDGDPEEGIWPGEGVASRLAEGLRQRGVAAEKLDLDDVGWAFFASKDGAQAYLLLAQSGEPADPWLLHVLDPSSGGPGPVELLPAIHEAVQGLAEIERVTWFARDDYTGDGGGQPYPLDE